MNLGHFVGSFFILSSMQNVQAAPNNYVRSPTIVEEMRTSRIVAGWPALEGQFPYQIYLRAINQIGTVRSCGGSIIHHRWVITAANCVANRQSFIIRLGLIDLAAEPEWLVETDLKHIHPRYRETVAGVQTDDIALIDLNQDIPYGPNIQPCRLQNSGQMNFDYTDIVLTASGYGLTDDVWNGGSASEILRWVYLRGISNEQCRNWYGGSTIIQEETICAQYYNDTAQSSCQGDNGGPLTVVDTDGQPTMVGVFTFGSTAGCNSPFPSGYVRPGHYHDWYLEVTGIDFDWSDDDITTDSTSDITTTESTSDTTTTESTSDTTTTGSTSDTTTTESTSDTTTTESTSDTTTTESTSDTTTTESTSDTTTTESTSDTTTSVAM